MRQTNPNWEAYFFVTDDKHFDTELLEILRSHRDNRLHFLDIYMMFRPKVNRCSHMCCKLIMIRYLKYMCCADIAARRKIFPVSFLCLCYLFHLFVQYNPVDAAYPASDEALRLVMQKPQCTRLSVTNGDNAYGSEVVASILSPTTPKADLILLPLDTRYFAAEGGCLCVCVYVSFLLLCLCNSFGKLLILRAIFYLDAHFHGSQLFLTSV